jgi:ketosteroid isomerase-like protein
MKTWYRILFGAVALGLVSIHAGQPSIDQLALESGVVAWVSAWNPGDKPFALAKLEPLYHPTVITRDADRTLQSWREYAASLQPRVEQFAQMTTRPADDLQMRIADGKAETSFVIHPTGKRRDGSAVTATTRVRLVWTKEGGMWRIAEQDIACSKDSDTSPVAVR